MTTILDAPLDVDAGTVTHFLLGGGFGIPAPVPDPEPQPANGQIWGSGQSMAPQLIRGVGVRGTVFSVQFKSDENGTPWTVHRLVNHMRSRRNPSVVRTEK